jgi:hypothetical protein
MKYIIPFLFLFISCKSKCSTNHSDSVTLSTPKEFDISYDSLKHRIQLERNDLKRMEINTKGIAKEISMNNLLALFPYWYGTKWNFYGTSEVPQQGSIACGYFVTTLLRDAGLNINRVKLAQQASSVIIQTVCDKENIKTFSNAKNEDFFDFIKRQGKSMYVVGLDFHTGFIYFDGEEIYFIQSKYYDEVAVVKEVATASKVLLKSKFKMLGRIDNSAKAGSLF